MSRPTQPALSVADEVALLRLFGGDRRRLEAAREAFAKARAARQAVVELPAPAPLPERKP